MTDIDLLNTIVNSGTSVIFLYLFWMAWKRAQALSDERVSIVRDCMDRLQRCHDIRDNEEPPGEI